MVVLPCSTKTLVTFPGGQVSWAKATPAVSHRPNSAKRTRRFMVSLWFTRKRTWKERRCRRTPGPGVGPGGGGRAAMPHAVIANGTRGRSAVVIAGSAQHLEPLGDLDPTRAESQEVDPGRGRTPLVVVAVPEHRGDRARTGPVEQSTDDAPRDVQQIELRTAGSCEREHHQRASSHRVGRQGETRSPRAVGRAGRARRREPRAQRPQVAVV